MNGMSQRERDMLDDYLTMCPEEEERPLCEFCGERLNERGDCECCADD